ncbi:MAG TPA: cytochrome C oxidase subunit IV family protein [Actinomycetota bacterium]|jgi:cytochrome c oxidase subunit IV|nr:cytochrome C oxidase subunit IV family protein [Actinomycetota bacterium]
MADNTETTIHDPGVTEHAGHEHAHPGVGEYVKIALILAVVTAAEVGLYYVEDRVGEGVTVAGLMAMMVVKFILVGLWFMHLRFDSSIFRRLFVAGIVLAIAIYAVVLVQMTRGSRGNQPAIRGGQTTPQLILPFR